MFNNSIFSTEYSGLTTRALVRAYSDLYSKEHCDMEEAKVFGADVSKGKCIYCGKPLYTMRGKVPIFTKDVQYDHLYPASEFNLFTRGNVVLSCASCNASKGAKDPIMFYEERLRFGEPTLYTLDEFKTKVDECTEVYIKDFPEIAKVGISNENEMSVSEIIKNYFSDLDLKLSPRLASWETSLNVGTWEGINELATENYSGTTLIDIRSRLSFTNDFFIETFGRDKLVEDCTIHELQDFGVNLLKLKSQYKGEVGKYRSLLSLMFQSVTDKSDELFSKMPTFKKLQEMQ